MSTDEQTATATANKAEDITTENTAPTADTITSAASDTTTSENISSEAVVERERSEKILKAKELYSHGSRNFLVKSYAEAADELSQVCALYEELHGELSDELGMPYLLYAKSLIALALDENKVIDVPDEEDDDDDDNDDEVEGEDEAEAASKDGDSEKKVETNGCAKLDTIKEDGADSTAEVDGEEKKEESDKSEDTAMEAEEKTTEESEVSSTGDDKAASEEIKVANGEKTNGTTNGNGVIHDDEKPSTSNGEVADDAVEDDEENEAASNLQLAWEILELAAKIFTRQGERGRPNLAEVHTELANIEFENNILDAARGDYEKALDIYKELANSYRRAMAEIHYKIGLSYLMQQLNKEGAASLKEACNLIADEIEEMKSKPDQTDKDKNNIQDMEETKQEIEAKIIEIEETQAQNVAEVRAALDNYIKPLNGNDADAGTSTSADATVPSSKSSGGGGSSPAISSSSKPNDISHLIKRKKPEDSTSEAEAVACSPAKRPAV